VQCAVKYGQLRVSGYITAWIILSIDTVVLINTLVHLFCIQFDKFSVFFYTSLHFDLCNGLNICVWKYSSCICISISQKNVTGVEEFWWVLYKLWAFTIGPVDQQTVKHCVRTWDVWTWRVVWAVTMGSCWSHPPAVPCVSVATHAMMSLVPRVRHARWWRWTVMMSTALLCLHVSMHQVYSFNDTVWIISHWNWEQVFVAFLWHSNWGIEIPWWVFSL